MTRTGPSQPLAAVVAKLGTAMNDAMAALGRVGRYRSRTLGALTVGVVAFSVWAVIDGGRPLFVQRVVDGLGNGFVYAAMAVALVLIYKATTVINFAQGEMAMFGTFVAYVFWDSAGWPAWLAVLAAMLVSALGAAGIERTLIRPFDPSNHLAITIITLGLFLILNAVAGVIWAYEPRGFPSPFPLRNRRFGLLGASVEWANLFTWLTVLAAVLAVTLLLGRTKIGLAFRAVSASIESSQLLGMHIGRTLQFGWALAAAMGTLAGSLIAPTTYLEPNFMGRVLVFSFAAATLGGLDSLFGAVLAGIIIGLVQTMSGGYIDVVGAELAPTIALLLIVAVLLIRPNGLFGSRTVERV